MLKIDLQVPFSQPYGLKWRAEQPMRLAFEFTVCRRQSLSLSSIVCGFVFVDGIPAGGAQPHGDPLLAALAYFLVCSPARLLACSPPPFVPALSGVLVGVCHVAACMTSPVTQLR